MKDEQHQAESPTGDITLDAANHDEVALELVETAEAEVFLATGDLSLLDADVVPLTFDPSSRDGSLTDSAAIATGAVNAGAQILHGIQGARGLVRLAPDTLSALQAGAQPLSSGGWNLGALAQNGKIAHAVRWAPAGAQGGVAVLAALGPAAALLAIQFQLAKISSLVKENIALTRSVLRTLKVDQWAAAKAHYEALAVELDHAKAVGKVTPSIWTHVQAQASETELRRQLDSALEDADELASSLLSAKTATERQKWLGDHSEALMRTTQTLLMAEHGWLLHQALRAASLQDRAQADPLEAVLQRRVVEAARKRHEEVVARVAALLTRVYRYLRLVERSPGSLGLTLFGRKATRETVTRTALHLANQLAALLDGTGQFEANPSAPRVAVPLTEPDESQRLTEQLRWVIEGDEDVVSLVATTSSRFLAFTDQRVLVLEKEAFLRSGELAEEVRWRDVSALTKVRESDRDDGFDLSLEYVAAGKKPVKRVYKLRGPALHDQGEPAVRLLQSLVPKPRSSAKMPVVVPSVEAATPAREA